MEAFGEANGQSLSDSFSLYERYMKSFNVVDTFSCNKLTFEEIVNEPLKTDVPLSSELDDCMDAERADDEVRGTLNTYNQSDLLLYEKKSSSNDLDFHSIECESLRGNLSSTCDYSFTDKLDLPGTSEDSKSDNSHHPKPVIITSLITMENSNNAVDSIPMFRPTNQPNVFKLPCELTFNGTLKHVQKLKPIVDPLTALSSSNIALASQEDMQCKNFTEENESRYKAVQISEDFNQADTKSDSQSGSNILNDKSDESSKLDGVTSTGDSQYSKSDKEKWSDSFSSGETSFDSGLRSPDMFSDGCDEDEAECESAKFWDFIHEFEAYDKCKIKKMEETLQGVPPPPSVTHLKTDVNEMLKKYYTYLPNFGVDSHINSPENNSVTPTKRQVFIRIPTIAELNEPKQEIANESSVCEDNVKVPEEKISTVNYDKQSEAKTSHSIEENTSIIPPIENDPITQEAVEIKACDGNMMESSNTLNSKDSNITNENEKSESSMNKSTENVTVKMCTENEARNTPWPDTIKCRFYDLHYNITKYSERIEQLAVKCSERFVGCDTDSTVTVYSGNSQSPSSATKRKAMRLKMAQAKSPGRRLSHLARRRQAFFSAANIGEKAHNSTSRMVLIDKNFFPHRKLVNTSDRKRTPGKKTPAKTPKSRSGGSSKKKAMRRLLLDHDLTRSQPTRETSRRALFISPEHRKSVPIASTSSVPVRAFKSKRALFSSPDAAAETKSEDGSRSDNFLKRKCSFDTESRHKMAKSLSFGGDCINSQPSSSTVVSRRASEMFSTKSMMAELDAQHRKKLLWAVSEALRVHGWRMQSPGFREKASALAQLTRRILTLPQHANRLSSPHLSTSDTLFKLARLHVFSIIQGKSIEECFQDEKVRLSEQAHRMAVYASNSMYQQRPKPSTSTMSQVKENLSATKQEQPKSTSKNVLQDKVVNIDSNSNSSSGLSMLEKTTLFKSNSMPSFEEAAKMRARRQISFDNVDFPKR